VKVVVFVPLCACAAVNKELLPLVERSAEFKSHGVQVFMRVHMEPQQGGEEANVLGGQALTKSRLVYIAKVGAQAATGHLQGDSSSANLALLFGALGLDDVLQTALASSFVRCNVSSDDSSSVNREPIRQQSPGDSIRDADNQDREQARGGQQEAHQEAGREAGGAGTPADGALGFVVVVGGVVDIASAVRFHTVDAIAGVLRHHLGLAENMHTHTEL
jgi:hypothetical protein